MVENLCTHYGRRVCKIKTDCPGKEGIKEEEPKKSSRNKRRREKVDLTKSEEISGGEESFYAFPSVAALAENPTKVEAKLRSLGFGYRAAYIAKSAAQIQEKGGEAFLLKLRQCTYEEARKELLQLQGIGPKVRI